MTDITDNHMYHYVDSGLKNVYLRNGFSIKETSYGEAVSIHNLKGLHRLIGLELANNKAQLTGAEIRFLRKELEFSQVDLAYHLAVEEPTIRHWESERGEITGPADRLLRWLYIEQVDSEGTMRQHVERIAQLNRNVFFKLNLEETDNGWKAVA